LPAPHARRKLPTKPFAAALPSCRHRRIIAGATWLITQKTNDDLFWLAPNSLVNSILLYLLALKAQKYRLLVHGFFVASNHIHLVVTDPEANLPAFLREFLGESAKAIKLARNTSRDIWRSARYSSVQLLDRDAAERSLGYLGLNPTEAGLTEPEEWPGLTSVRHRFGDTIVAERPGIYFSKGLSGAFPEHREESGEHGARGDFGASDRSAIEEADSAAMRDSASEAQIGAIIETRAAEIRAALAKEGRKLSGPQRVMRTPCTKRTTHPIRNLNPRFATRDRALLALAVAELRQFEIDHEVAKRRYIAGQQRTLFPLGTYGYRVVLGVRVAKRRRRAA
jgi:REP element-mobilizing transposase RayT